MSKFKSIAIPQLMEVADNDKPVMRDFMFMCHGMWTDKELQDAYREGIISKEDLDDLKSGMLVM